MISIGLITGGPGASATILQAIRAAMKAAIEVCGDFHEGSSPAVNVVFCVPGSILKPPDWEHGKVAKYSAKEKLVLVQVAVPREISSPSALDFVIEELHGANALAYEFYRQKGMRYALADAEKFVSEINALAASKMQT